MRKTHGGICWTVCAEAGDLRNAILNLVRERDSLTFRELQQALAPYCTVFGKALLHYPDVPMCVLWTHMSRELAEALQNCMATGEIRFAVVPASVYRKTGWVPPARARHFPPHPVEGELGPRRRLGWEWLPVVLLPGDAAPVEL
jgi:hypothetical protein